MGSVVFIVFVLCGIYVQNRGVVQHGKLLRKITDHANLLAPINCVFYLFSSIKNTPFVDVKNFPELRVIDENWEMIRDEALSLNAAAQIKASDDLDDLGFNSFFRTGWKRFYLKWYGGTNLKSAQQLCPKTVELLSTIPSVKAAVFTMLPPGSRLGEHRDPYAGSLRYHLGLVTPNSEECNIVVDGQKYCWKDGESVIFDETYIHHAENNTNENRIILFLDIKRPVRFVIIDWFNEILSYTLMAASATKNMKGDKVGVINKAFHYVFKIRNWVRKLKGINKPLYNFIQYGFYIGMIFLIFF
ncbi:aspartyl/asparaginyl beta-hydroxylase domain-containing protein [Gallaecimonas sp. GXIMD1310]|uniref:aspartyl/asparaginyl beta-hydroxylase domain-containing protein n=1 Tax=Gallaecimonas sp. GXIMD1310 TaxID=3131926 RepID=UPI003251A38C